MNEEIKNVTKSSSVKEVKAVHSVKDGMIGKSMWSFFQKYNAKEGYVYIIDVDKSVKSRGASITYLPYYKILTL